MKIQKTKYVFECNLRFFFTWLILTALACLVYIFVVFGSMVNKNVLPSNNVPMTIPYITVPSKYDVYLEFKSTPEDISEDYTGSLLMNFVARDVTQRLFFHRGAKVKITSISLEDSNGTLSSPTAGAYDKSTNVQAYFPISNLTSNGTYTLRIDFEGTLDSQDSGPIHIGYSASNGTRNSIIFGHPATSSSGLRYLMPCLDSSDFPAIFNFNVRHSPSYHVISNFAGRIQQTTMRTVTLFNATFAIDPSQVALALVDAEMTPVVVQQSRLTVNKYYRKSVVNNISTARIIQFMSAKTAQIGKIDALALPSLTAIQQPGISFYNENDVLRENLDLGSITSSR